MPKLVISSAFGGSKSVWRTHSYQSDHLRNVVFDEGSARKEIWYGSKEVHEVVTLTIKSSVFYSWKEEGLKSKLLPNIDERQDDLIIETLRNRPVDPVARRSHSISEAKSLQFTPVTDSLQTKIPPSFTDGIAQVDTLLVEHSIPWESELFSTIC